MNFQKPRKQEIMSHLRIRNVTLRLYKVKFCVEMVTRDCFKKVHNRLRSSSCNDNVYILVMFV